MTFAPHIAQVAGLVISEVAQVSEAVAHALEQGYDMLLLDGSGGLGTAWPELAGAPDLAVLRETIRRLRELKREEHIDLVYFGGVRSGTDAAKLIAMGAKAVVLGVAAGLAAGGEIRADHTLGFSADREPGDRAQGVVNILKASAGEASMMARASGKTKLHSLEPEDLRSVTLSTAAMTGIRLVGHL